MKVDFSYNQTFRGIKNVPAPKAFPGKHKLPRYLYHFTDGDLFESILKEGAIKGTSGVGEAWSGIFMVDMNNFLKYWKADKSWNEVLSFSKSARVRCSLTYALLKWASKNNRDIVCLKIPTEGLDFNKLQIRSQNRLFSKDFAHDFESALNKGLYNQRKEAVEYFYRDKIPLEKFQFIGSAKLSILSRLGLESDYNMQHKLALKTLSKVFSGQPENKGIQNELKKISLFERVKKFISG